MIIREGFKIRRGKTRTGSSPVSGTTESNVPRPAPQPPLDATSGYGLELPAQCIPWPGISRRRANRGARPASPITNLYCSHHQPLPAASNRLRGIRRRGAIRGHDRPPASEGSEGSEGSATDRPLMGDPIGKKTQPPCCSSSSRLWGMLT